MSNPPMPGMLQGGGGAINNKHAIRKFTFMPYRGVGTMVSA